MGGGDPRPKDEGGELRAGYSGVGVALELPEVGVSLAVSMMDDADEAPLALLWWWVWVVLDDDDDSDASLVKHIAIRREAKASLFRSLIIFYSHKHIT